MRRETASIPILLGTLGTVAAACLHTLGNTQRVEHTANHLVSHTGKVANTTASDEDDGVLLKVMAFTWNVSRDFFSIGKSNTSHLSEGGVRLLRSYGFHQ